MDMIERRFVTFTAVYSKPPSEEDLAKLREAHELGLKKLPKIDLVEEYGEISIDVDLIDEVNEANPPTQSTIHLSTDKAYIVSGKSSDILKFLKEKFNFHSHEFTAESPEIA